MNKLQSIALHQKSIYTNNTYTLACLWKTKWYKCKQFRDVSLYKSSVRKKINTSMWFTGVSFFNFLYVDNIGNYLMVFFKSCCSLILWPPETEKIIKQSFCFPIQTYCQTFEHTESLFLLCVFRWHRTFVIWNLRVCWFMRLANHLHLLKFYK